MNGTRSCSAADCSSGPMLCTSTAPVSSVVVCVVHDDDAQAVCADDLEADLGERTDLAQQEPEILASMVANLTAWWESVRHSIAAESKCPNDPTTGHGRPSRSIPVRPIQSHPAGC